MSRPVDRLKAESEVHPHTMWAEYSKAMGVKKMIACYGWPEPPAAARWGETVYTFKDTRGHRVAWSSLCSYPKETDCFELALGVWPRYQGRGFRKQILEETAAIAFEQLKAEAVTMLVLDSCSRHQEICMAESVQGGLWTYSGEHWFPDAYKAFTLIRPAWETR